MEKWRTVFRRGLAPHLPTAGLQALAFALASDNPSLLQGTTCYPPPLAPLKDRAAEASCALTYAATEGKPVTVAEADTAFQMVCEAADLPFKEPASCRYFLNWYDDVPRDVMRRELLAEVEAELSRRAAVQVA